MADDHRYSCRKQDTQIFTNFSSNSSHSYHQPSFSSLLLDSIYRSIEEEMVTYEEPIRSRNKMENLKSEKELMANLRRASMIEKWMEKKVTEKPVADVKNLRKDRRSSSISSSDSSCAGGAGFFSSSESESFPVRRPKPVRTGVSGFDQKEKLDQNRRDRSGSGKAEHGGGFSKTKSRALQMYGDLKKEKWQPISPGGKVAAFLNSLFASGAGSLRKPKISSDYSPSLKSMTCSSASSFSRSCLSKTPASSKSSGGGAKRSVRFFPLSVIVGEDCQPCGHKSLHRENESAIDEELIRHIMEKNRRADQEAEGDSQMSYQKKISHEFEILRKAHIENLEFDHDFDGEDDDFDTASCASSDLFELDNLSEIGMERYSEELPVYETTHLDTNRAIANGSMIL